MLISKLLFFYIGMRYASLLIAAVVVICIVMGALISGAIQKDDKSELFKDRPTLAHRDEKDKTTAL